MPRGPAVPLLGIWLLRVGDYAVVLAEKPDGTYAELMRERVDAPFSHMISEHGIAKVFTDGVTKKVTLT
ncbi:MAG TPA: hypothetical protein VF748_14575 [Candidatus Acidoferrum sp.]